MSSLAKSASRPSLSNDAASKLLANVFDACEQDHNSIPLETLTSYSEYRREKHGLQKTLLIIILVIFVALPFCFIAPEFDIQCISAEPGKLPIYEIRVGGFLPINLVASSIEGHSFTVYETGDRLFSVEPADNGVMKVKVRLMNRQYAVKEIKVDGIDMIAPVLIADKIVGDQLYFTVQDDGQGVDYENIQGFLNSDREGAHPVKPVAYDEKEGIIIFAFPEESMNIIIPDKSGNELQLVLTIT